jgi:uncharacterized membrane protein YvbJ
MGLLWKGNKMQETKKTIILWTVVIGVLILLILSHV